MKYLLERRIEEIETILAHARARARRANLDDSFNRSVVAAIERQLRFMRHDLKLYNSRTVYENTAITNSTTPARRDPRRDNAA